MAIPTLPASDPSPDERAARLASRREEYRWSYTQLPPLAMVERVPKADQPSLRWALGVIDLVIKVIENDYAIALDDRLAAQHFNLAREVARLYHEFDRAALAEGRVYLADYGALEGLEPGTFPDGQKYASPALALFAVPPASAPGPRSLVPVAIQCAQTPTVPLFTPRDGVNWDIAKSIVAT